jgi:hypothetical protein
MPPARPLSALLSQVLIAFTVEFDNEFERRMGEAGHPGARLSLVIWTSLMRFVADSPLSVRDLAAKAQEPETQIKFKLGCLERWGFVKLNHREPHADGWGSGRGIRADWTVHLTSKGLIAGKIFPPLFEEIEKRWEKRFGKEEINQLRQNLSLPISLRKQLQNLQLEFDNESPAPLLLSANAIRVLSEQPIRLAEMIRRTGGSRETSDIGWQLKPYVIVEPDPTATRGKVVSLSPRGLLAQAFYHHLTKEIEKRWEERLGKATIRTLRESLENLFETPELSKGMIPPPGTARAGDQYPALGRRDVGPAARQRMRDLVAQTEAFVNDPAGNLPHYPAWDMNRGFGP